MVSKTMKYATAVTCRWALGLGRHSCSILSYAYWCVETRSVGTKFRPKASTSISLCDSWLEKRFLMGLFLKFVCNSWRIRHLVLLKFSPKNFLNEVLEYGLLSRATVAELLGPFLRVALIYMPGRKGGEILG